MSARLLDVGPDEYHRLPQFSASTAKVVNAQSALHAWQVHPAFGAKGKTATKPMDRGSAIHTFLLGAGKRIAPAPFKDWRTNAAKETRENYRKAGLVPLLTEDYEEYKEASEEIRKTLGNLGHFISPEVGRSEFALEWEEPSSHGPVKCRCMMDNVILDTGHIYEVKVVDNAHPDRCQKSSEDMGYDIAAAAYVRALAAYAPHLIGRIRFQFLFCEPEAPYAVWAPEPTGAFLERGERKWLDAVEKWSCGLHRNDWPHYQHERHIDAPAWKLRQEGYLQ